jgi:hypothetical protein
LWERQRAEVVVVSGGAWAVAWAVEEHYNAGVGLVTGIGLPSQELLIGRGSQHGGSVENCICRYVIFSKASPLLPWSFPCMKKREIGYEAQGFWAIFVHS